MSTTDAVRATVREHHVDGKGQWFLAEAEGIEVIAKAPGLALCTKLAEAGYADRRLEVHDAVTGRLRFTIASIGKAAGWTLKEAGWLRCALRAERTVPKAPIMALPPSSGTLCQPSKPNANRRRLRSPRMTSLHEAGFSCAA